MKQEKLDISDEIVLKSIKTCWDNHIFIVPKPIDSSKKPMVRILMKIGGIERIGQSTYTQKDVYSKIFELYVHYADKVKNK